METPQQDERPPVVVLDYPNTKDVIAGDKIPNPAARVGLNLGLSLFLCLAGIIGLWPGTEHGIEWALILGTMIGWLGLFISAGALIFGAVGSYRAGKPNVEGHGPAIAGAMLGIVGLVLMGAYLSNLNDIKSRYRINKPLVVRPRISMVAYSHG